MAKYGWLPDLPDHRDHVYAVPARVVLPPRVDLRPQCPTTIYDQGQLGSCTANAIAFAFQFDLMKQKSTVFMPSRLFIYYNERAIENTVSSDSGAMLRDGIKTVSRDGVCDEEAWPYSDQNPGVFTTRPSVGDYAQARLHRVSAYQRVQRSLVAMKSCLASGYPFVFGFSVYESFESDEVARTGIVPMPSTSEALLGGHAPACVGYDDLSRGFIVRNSWGPNWGMLGYCSMPYEYFLDPDLSSDFWTLRAVL